MANVSTIGCLTKVYHMFTFLLVIRVCLFLELPSTRGSCKKNGWDMSDEYLWCGINICDGARNLPIKLNST
jgi:hypothetical protein